MDTINNNPKADTLQRVAVNARLCEVARARREGAEEVQIEKPAEPATTARDLGELENIDRAILEDDRRMLAQRRESAAPGAQASKLAKLPALLRFIGAVTLIASAAAFMLQGWPGMNHVARYYSFLLFTALLSGAGFFCGLRLKEDKGARTFLATAAAIVPVHFCQLGALIYSQFPEKLVKYPAWLLWVAPSKGVAFSTAVAGTLALIPIVFISFSTLARAEARRLTALYVGANLMLLVPTRSPDLVSFIALLSFLGVIAVEICYTSRVSLLRTREGIFIRTMLAAPFMLIIGRTMNLYDADFAFYSMLLATLSIFLFVMLPHYIGTKGSAAIGQALAAIPAFFAWLLFVCRIALDGGVLDHYAALLVGLPYAALLLVMSCYALAYNSIYRRSAAVVATVAIILQLIVFPGLIASLFCLTVGVLLMSYGFTTEQRTIAVSGGIGFCAGLLYHLRYAIDFYRYSPWISLAVVGVLVVLASSLIERHHVRLVAKFGEMKRLFVAR